MSTPSTKDKNNQVERNLVRLSLFSFLITFIFLRALVFFIMKFKAYHLYVFINGKHIHHFTDGFILITLLAGYMIFFSPKKTWFIALLYGLALGLAFDEFGMWISLNIDYWQASSLYAIACIGTLLAFFAYPPTFKRRRVLPNIGLIALIICTLATINVTAHFLHAEYNTRLISWVSSKLESSKSMMR